MKQEQVIRAAKEIDNAIVMHPRFRLAYDGIFKIIEMASVVSVPIGATVTAPSGCGKTALIHTIQRSMSSGGILTSGPKCLSMAAEASATVGHLVAQIMRQLGYPTTIRASTLHEQSELLASALRERGIVAIFLDESQHIGRGRRTLMAAAITDWIKQVADRSGVVFIMLGTPELRPLRETNDQLGSRAPAHFELKAFDLNEEWVGLLKQLSTEVRSFDISSVVTTFYRQLHRVTGGALRPLKQMLIASTLAAHRLGKTALDKECLAAGHEQVFGPDPHIPNPFADA